ncbi:TadE/TadG family type IV pilus assembly protein [Halalkalibacter alkalisediminis]|uniref:TadE/TadG family type IV pilus assembly protein n=1 Tax=Halalkalibacter alkalisediminis TaxID=935616 RepID=A0ABV6NKP3_9BACI|nr:TadE/TadG family type IV pilus assembly protein [Halalkalibacter alkalisediminis]
MAVLRKLKSEEKGQSVTEFAIILPVFVLLITGVLVLGSIIYAKTVVVLAASQAARVGGAIYDDSSLTLYEKDEKIRNTALTVVSNGLTGEDRTVTITQVGNEIKVKVSYTYYIPLPLIRSLFSNHSVDINFTSSYLIL